MYTSVLERTKEIGVMKAIGAKNNELMKMILFQAAIVGFLGYGFGILLSSVLIALAKLRLPDYASLITFTNLLASLVMVLIIAGLDHFR